MLVRTDLIRKIGMLDTGFFAYFEDIDYSARSIQAGFRSLVDSNSIVRHREKNRNTKPFEINPHYWYYMARNESRFWRKTPGTRERNASGVVQLQWISAAQNRLTRKPESANAILAGLWGWVAESRWAVSP